jgi:uncharacterized protein YndB with AHSA1/START domain
MSQQRSDPIIAAWLKSTERWVRWDDDASSASLCSRYDAPVEKVWMACIDRAQLSRWFAEVSGELYEGATVTFDVGAPHRVSARILRRDPNRTLVFTWSYPGGETDEVDIRLEADGDGTLLKLEQRSKARTDWWLGAGAGWESALIRLHLLLQGEDPRKISDQEFDEILGPLWIEAGRASPSS